MEEGEGKPSEDNATTSGISRAIIFEGQDALNTVGEIWEGLLVMWLMLGSCNGDGVRREAWYRSCGGALVKRRPLSGTKLAQWYEFGRE